MRVMIHHLCLLAASIKIVITILLAKIWSPLPPLNFCKLNFDGSKYSNGNALIGFVIKNSAEGVLLAGEKALGPLISIVQAEVWALREGIKVGIFLGISHLIIEGDNLGVIKCFKISRQIP